MVANKKLEELEDTDEEGKSEEFKEPTHLQIHASRVIATNCRLSGVDHQAASTRSDLAECLQTLSETGNLFSKYEQMKKKTGEANDSFPWSMEHCVPIPKRLVFIHLIYFYLHGPMYKFNLYMYIRLVDHAAGHDVIKEILADGNVSCDSSNNFWSIHFDPLWADFLSEEENKKRRYPFIDPIPLTLWVMDTPCGEGIDKGINLLIMS